MPGLLPQKTQTRLNLDFGVLWRWFSIRGRSWSSGAIASNCRTRVLLLVGYAMFWIWYERKPEPDWRYGWMDGESGNRDPRQQECVCCVHQSAINRPDERNTKGRMEADCQKVRGEKEWRTVLGPLFISTSIVNYQSAPPDTSHLPSISRLVR